MQTILLVGSGGAIGALLRYIVSGCVHRILGIGFPWGTLAVNVLGCLFIGFAWAFAEASPVSPAVRVFFLTGILGAFTTFSAFGIETISLLRQGDVALGIANVIGSNVAGLLAVVGGFALARLLLAAGNGG